MSDLSRLSAVLGLDVGGANLKAATTAGAAVTRPFALWRQPQELPTALAELIASVPGGRDCGTLALTMTAELCDCYATKAVGVSAVLDAVESAAEGRAIRVWFTDGRFASPSDARARPLLAAASNWLATATLAGRWCPCDSAILLDIGSTTTDIVPILNGQPVPLGRTDPERLAVGELVYTGVARTPICAVVRTLSWRGRRLPVAAELFATTRDAHIVTGGLPEQPADSDTADQRPATLGHSLARLARVICADLDLASEAEVRELAEQIVAAQRANIRAALRTVAARLPSPPSVAVLAGTGEFLAESVLAELGNAQPIRLSRQLGEELSAVAPAYAVAVLLAEAEFDRRSPQLG